MLGSKLPQERLEKVLLTQAADLLRLPLSRRYNGTTVYAHLIEVGCCNVEPSTDHLILDSQLGSCSASWKLLLQFWMTFKDTGTLFNLERSLYPKCNSKLHF
eukprot:m.341589 g.341589  ORF g.341589 m.341589 type:complete len:102 (-) comp16113_c0_seq13:1640-1945(-)